MTTKKLLFSRPEVSFTRDGIAQNLRSDGRDNAQSRATDIVSLGNHRASLGERKKRRDAMNAITRAVGHARVRMGRTEVVCAISGRIASSDDEEEDKEDEEEDALLLFTIGQKRKEKDDKATTTPGGLSTSIEVYVETMSTRNIGGTSTSFGQQQQVLFNETDKYCGGLKRALEFAYGSVDLNDANGGGGLRKSLEINGGSRSHDSTRRSHWRHRWKLRMDFLVLSDDGNVLDALAIAGKCALFDARLPRVRVKRRGEEEEVELMFIMHRPMPGQPQENFGPPQLVDSGGRRYSWAMMETRQIVFAKPHLSDPIVSLSADVAFGEKWRQSRRWMFVKDSGVLLGVHDSVGVCMDLDARRAMPIPADVRQVMERNCLPQLG